MWSQTYSNYKSANIFKRLVAISPARHIIFVSSLYTVSISDTKLVECSGFLSLLRVVGSNNYVDPKVCKKLLS